MAFDALAFNAAEILAVAAIPQAFGISDPRHLSLADLQTFTLFKELVRQFDNKSAGLIDYLRRPPDTTLPGPTTLALSALSHWPPAQIATLERRFWPTQPAPMGPGTVRLTWPPASPSARPPGWRSRRCCASTAWATCRPPTPRA